MLRPWMDACQTKNYTNGTMRMRFLRTVPTLLLLALFLEGCQITVVPDEFPKLVKSTSGRLIRDYSIDVYASAGPERMERASTCIYFFHSVNGDRESWKTYADTYRALAETVDFYLVSVSFGDRWFLTNSAQEYQFHIPVARFAELLLNEVERAFPGKIANRIVMGTSMGAYNAAELAFRYPQAFSQALLISASILPIDPFSDESDILSEIDKIERNAQPIRHAFKKALFWKSPHDSAMWSMLAYQRTRFVTHDNWNASDILETVKSAANLPNTYISYGESDIYGAGNQLLAELARDKATHLEIHELKGGHTAFDGRSLCDFIVARLAP